MVLSEIVKDSEKVIAEQEQEEFELREALRRSIADQIAEKKKQAAGPSGISAQTPLAELPQPVRQELQQDTGTIIKSIQASQQAPKKKTTAAEAKKVKLEKVASFTKGPPLRPLHSRSCKSVSMRDPHHVDLVSDTEAEVQSKAADEADKEASSKDAQANPASAEQLALVVPEAQAALAAQEAIPASEKQKEKPDAEVLPQVTAAEETPRPKAPLQVEIGVQFPTPVAAPVIAHPVTCLTSSDRKGCCSPVTCFDRSDKGSSSTRRSCTTSCSGSP